jgi:hypothetical protein
MPLRVLACLLTCCVAAQAATLVTWAGEQRQGELTYARNAWQVTNGDQRQTLPASEVAAVRFDARRHHAGEEGGQVTLIDGSRISGTIGLSSQLETVPVARGEEQLELPGDQVAMLEFGPLDPGASPGAMPPPPYVIMRNGKTVAATLSWLTYLEIGIGTEAGRLRLSRDQVHRMILRQSAATTPQNGAVRLSTVLGDSVGGQLISLDQDSATLRVGKLDLRFRRDRLLRIDSSDRRSTSLLALKPAKITTTPYLGLVREPRFNHSLFDGALLGQGIRYQQGIATHSRTAISYELGGRFDLLMVDVGIDPTISEQGAAVCVIKGDGKELQRLELDADKAVQPLLCPLSGVNRLELLVDFGPGGSSGDYVTWGDPQLIAH